MYIIYNIVYVYVTIVGVLLMGNRMHLHHLGSCHQPQKWRCCWVAQHRNQPSPRSCLLQRPTGLWQWCNYTLYWWDCYILSVHQLCRASLHMKQELGTEWEGLLFASIHPFVAGSTVGLQSVWLHSTLLSTPGSWHLLVVWHKIA